MRSYDDLYSLVAVVARRTFLCFADLHLNIILVINQLNAQNLVL